MTLKCPFEINRPLENYTEEKKEMFQGFCIIKNQENSAEKQVEKLLISFPKGQIQHFYVKTRRGPMLLSMISLLTHTVAHFTRHSFTAKTNNLPLKKSF